MREAEIQTASVKLIGTTVPGVCLWRNSVGLTGHDPKCSSCGYVYNQCPRCGVQHNDDEGPRIRYGLAVGSSDYVGLDYFSQGRFIGIEFKVPGRKPNPKQEMWLDLVRRRGGFAAVCTSPEETKAAIERCRQGHSE